MILGSAAPIFLLDKGGSIVQVLNNAFSGANSTPILAVPLFILGGVIMAEGGISRRLVNFFVYFVGRFPGGIPCAVILTCLFYGAISGSGPATTAAVGAMCVPFMISLGYDRKWSAGLIAVAGGLGVIIPSSVPFVLYSLATGVSTGDLFLGGDADLLRQMQSNDIQLVVCQTAPVVSFIPEMAVFDLPMVFSKYDGDTIDSVLNGDNEFHNDLAAAYEAADLHLLGFLQNATYRLTTANTDLSTLESFKNL